MKVFYKSKCYIIGIDLNIKDDFLIVVYIFKWLYDIQLGCGVVKRYIRSVCVMLYLLEKRVE